MKLTNQPCIRLTEGAGQAPPPTGCLRPYSCIYIVSLSTDKITLSLSSYLSLPIGQLSGRQDDASARRSQLNRSGQ